MDLSAQLRPVEEQDDVRIGLDLTRLAGLQRRGQQNGVGRHQGDVVLVTWDANLQYAAERAGPAVAGG